MKDDYEADVKVLRVFAFLLGNFAIRTQVTFHHVGGTKKKIVVLLSRRKQSSKQPQAKDIRKQAVEVLITQIEEEGSIRQKLERARRRHFGTTLMS